MKLEYSQQIFETFINIKFHENPSSGSRVFLSGRMDRRTDMLKLIVAVHNIANAPKKTTNHNFPVYVEGIQSNFLSPNPYALNPRL